MYTITKADSFPNFWSQQRMPTSSGLKCSPNLEDALEFSERLYGTTKNGQFSLQPEPLPSRTVTNSR